MPYGTIKIDTITFTDGGVDKSVPVSGLVQNPTFTGNVTVTGTISGNIIQGGTTVSGVTITGTTVSTTTGNFTSLTGTTATITSGIIASGTAALPSLAILSDPNTGIYSPGADQLAVATNGTQRLNIGSTGHIGNSRSIATAFSGANAATWTNGLTLANTAAPGVGVSNLIAFEGTSNVNAVFGVTQAGSTYGDFVWAAYNGSFSETMRLTSAGRLGIGSSSPGGKLEILQNSTSNTTPAIRITGSSGDPTNYFLDVVPIFNGSTVDYRFDLKSISTNTALLYLSGAGRVGIGTTGPERPLDVYGPTNGYAAHIGGQLHGLTRGLTIGTFENGGAADCGVEFNAALNNTGFGAFTFKAGSNEHARIDTSGRLLVGTSTARSNFFNAAVTAPLQIEGGNTGLASISIVQNANDGDGPRLILGKSRSTTNTVVQSDDRIGGIEFQGNDAGEFVSAANIQCFVDGTPGANDMPGRLVFSTNPGSPATGPTERMRIDNAGNLTVNDTGGTQYSAKVYVNGSIAARNGGVDGGYQNAFVIGYTGNFNEKNIIKTAVAASASASGFQFMVSNGAGSASVTESFLINRASCAVIGSLSKGSGSFKISHPLPEKTDTHYLVHSFIEGPQADLIYRGHVALVDGTAQVNIDEAGRMTEGTFEALCTNVCCFTSNETDWTPVRGHVDGNILSIEAQDPTSTAEVCWMVIGERKDQHILDTDWTDENGRVITEPMKEVTPSVTQ